MNQILVYVVLVWVGPQDLSCVAPPLGAKQDAPKPPYEATVQTGTSRVREKASSTAKTLVVLKERDTVTVLEVTEGFAKVKTSGGVEGWVSLASIVESATYASKEKAAGGDPKAGAESHGYTKGFDPATENEFKNKEGLTAEYAKIDKLEGMAFRKDADTLEARIASFRKQGNLGEFRK